MNIHQSARCFPSVIVCLAAAILVSGCGKPMSAEQKAEQAAIERHEQDFQQQRSEWQAFQKFRSQPWEKFPAGPSTEEAIQFLIQKFKQGQVPDMEDAEHSVQFHFNPFATNYPLSRTFNVQMKSGGFANHYTVIKESATDSWKVQRAWRTDAHGNVVKTYPVDNM